MRYKKRLRPKATRQREHVNEAGFSVQHRPDSLLSAGASGVLNVKRVRKLVWSVSSTCLRSRKKVTMVTATRAAPWQEPKAFCKTPRDATGRHMGQANENSIRIP